VVSTARPDFPRQTASPSRPPRPVVDIAAINLRRQATRDSQRRRAAAVMLLAPLALAGLILADPFGSPAPAPNTIALPRLPVEVPGTPPEAGPRLATAPAETVARPAGPKRGERLHPRERVAAVAPRAPLSSTLPSPSLADPPDGFLPGEARTANPPLHPAKPQNKLEAEREVAVIVPSPPTHATPDLGGSPPMVETEQLAELGQRLVVAALDLTKIPGGYDPKYLKISYPMGDVPEGWGVCSDVIVRAFRGLGVDLQQLVHTAKLGTGDANVDHRRVTVLMKFFVKNAQSLPILPYPESYKPGDVVAYDVPWGRSSKWHIAIVSDQLSPSLRPMVVHNRGYGAKLEDALFHKRIIGHYRFDAASLTALRVKAAPAPAQAAATADGKTPPRMLAKVSTPRG
jgi:uncharacterized protein